MAPTKGPRDVGRTMQIGRRIRELREEKGLGQAELARRAGLYKNTLYRFEKGLQTPGAGMVDRLAGALDVEPGVLFEEGPGKANVPSRPGPEEVSELLGRLGAKTRNLADSDLTRDLAEASDAAVVRVIRETRQELELLVPELRRLREELKPGDDGYMGFNRALAETSRQVLAVNMLLLARAEAEPQEEVIALRSLSRRLLDLAVA
jgi:transcriptional regulator with XRE-family HTH domain